MSVRYQDINNCFLQVVTPSGNVLVDDLTLRVESGSNLLITGNVSNYLSNICPPKSVLESWL
jgi:hypothetical protein